MLLYRYNLSRGRIFRIMSKAKVILAKELEKYNVNDTRSLRLAIIEAKRKYSATRFMNTLGLFGLYYFSRAEKVIQNNGYRYKDFIAGRV